MDRAVQDLTSRLKVRALELGFDAVGVAPVAPYDHADAFRRWLDAGMHGEMAYMPRTLDKRLDPERVVPGAQSIVCLATLYRTSTERPPEHAIPSRGIVSCYAWGDDYHELLGARTEELAAWIDQNAGATSRAYVDSGPVLEREAAARAGIGWFGKNTMLLNRRMGSYFFLSEIITTAALEPDSPTTDHCGSCRRCLDACPTQAFPEPYVLDARRCISYLTIELKGEVPEPLREAVGNHVFGCDICQEVCPWNRKAARTGESAFVPRPGLTAAKLASLMSMAEDAFQKVFQNSPIMRAKRRGLLRNVAIALGNTRNPKALEPLTVGLEDPEPLVRSHVAWAIGRIGGKKARAMLRAAASRERDDSVLASIRRALGVQPDPSSHAGNDTMDR
ncbi:tRNA epoxyqueuosine(34) reductase QueG [Candidatus Poribacteria bacterium]|nr:tRNA epoxyqueuosine(34) reductase QueG [Candidatus Poribacteria bacterium]